MVVVGGTAVLDVRSRKSCPEGDNRTIEICRCRNNLIGLSIINILLASPMVFDPYIIVIIFFRSNILGYPDRITVNGGALRNNNNNKTTMALAGIYRKRQKIGFDLLFFLLEISKTRCIHIHALVTIYVEKT